MKSWNFTQVRVPSGMQSCSSMIRFFERHKILITALIRRRKWAYRRKGFVGLKKGVQSMTLIQCSILAFPGEELYHGGLFQLIFNFHMARRMHCVWFVSFFPPNNPKSASTPLAPASTHAFEVNYVAPSPSTTLPSPSLPSA